MVICHTATETERSTHCVQAIRSYEKTETETEREAERIVLYCIVGQIFTNFFKQMTSSDFICTIQLNCIVIDLY